MNKKQNLEFQWDLAFDKYSVIIKVWKLCRKIERCVGAIYWISKVVLSTKGVHPYGTVYLSKSSCTHVIWWSESYQMVKMKGGCSGANLACLNEKNSTWWFYRSFYGWQFNVIWWVCVCIVGDLGWGCWLFGSSSLVVVVVVVMVVLEGNEE